jgi:hypothetical protein
VKLLIALIIMYAVGASAQSAVTFQNATTNIVTVNGSDASGASFVLMLSPGQTLKQLFTGASFSNGTWTQAQPMDGTEMQILVCGPVTGAGPTFLTALTPQLVPDSMTIIQYWVWGVCTAIVLGLAGSMRRMLGRVHEVNTDL